MAVRSVRMWVVVVCLCATGLGVINVVYIESELQDRRDELSNLFDS